MAPWLIPTLGPSEATTTYGAWISGRTNGRATVSGADDERLAFDASAANTNAIANVEKKLGEAEKIWFEVEVISTPTSMSDTWLGICLAWFFDQDAAKPTNYRLAVDLGNGAVYSGGSNVGFCSPLPNLSQGDVVGIGIDMATGQFVIHKNGSEIYNDTHAQSYYTGFGDIGWRHIFLSRNSTNANADTFDLQCDSASFQYTPASGFDDTWSQTASLQPIETDPSAWLKGGESPTDLYAQNVDTTLDAQTIELLIKAPSTEVATTQDVGAKRSGGATSWLIRSVGSSVPGALQFSYRTVGFGNINQRINQLYDGAWHRYSIVNDGVDKLQVFVDGVKKLERTVSGSMTPYDANRTAKLLFGASTSTNAVDFGVCDLRLFDDARTPTEVADAIDYKAVDETEPGLIGLWYCDEGSGTTIENEIASGVDDMTATDAAIWQT